MSWRQYRLQHIASIQFDKNYSLRLNTDVPFQLKIPQFGEIFFIPRRIESALWIFFPTCCRQSMYVLFTYEASLAQWIFIKIVYTLRG